MVGGICRSKELGMLSLCTSMLKIGVAPTVVLVSEKASLMPKLTAEKEVLSKERPMIPWKSAEKSTVYNR